MVIQIYQPLASAGIDVIRNQFSESHEVIAKNKDGHIHVDFEDQVIRNMTVVRLVRLLFLRLRLPFLRLR